MSGAGTVPGAARKPTRRRAAAPSPRPRRRPFWLDSPRRPPPRPPLDERRRGGARDRRRRAQRACGPRCCAKERDPRSRGGGPRRRRARRRGQRSQRRLSLLLSHPRDRQRDRALSRRDADARAARPRELRRRSRPRSSGSRSTATFEASGDLDVAVEPHEVEWLGRGGRVRCAASATRSSCSTASTVRARGPLAALRRRRFGGRSGAALVDPARLCWGLARVAEELGVRIHERTAGGGGRAQRAPGVALRDRRTARVERGRALLATSAFPGLVRRDSAAGRPGLGLRARHRAAHRRSSARRSAGATARGSATWRTASTTTG